MSFSKFEIIAEMERRRQQEQLQRELELSKMTDEELEEELRKLDHINIEKSIFKK